MHSISFQLYSARHFDFEEVLALLAHLGIREVEGYGALYEDPKRVKQKLDEHGLVMSTGHFGLEVLEGNPSKVLEIVENFDMDAVIVPYLGPEERPTDKAGWDALAKRVVRAGGPIFDRGLTYGWHNHDFEFQADRSGHFPIQSIMAADDRMMLELDLAWVYVAGQDPISWMQTYSNRLVAAHIKDCASKGENKDEDGWADVGHGVLDWRALTTALHDGNVSRWILEHDLPNDIKRFATRSHKTISQF